MFLSFLIVSINPTSLSSLLHQNLTIIFCYLLKYLVNSTVIIFSTTSRFLNVPLRSWLYRPILLWLKPIILPKTYYLLLPFNLFHIDVRIYIWLFIFSLPNRISSNAAKAFSPKKLYRLKLGLPYSVYGWYQVNSKYSAAACFYKSLSIRYIAQCSFFIMRTFFVSKYI